MAKRGLEQLFDWKRKVAGRKCAFPGCPEVAYKYTRYCCRHYYQDRVRGEAGCGPPAGKQHYGKWLKKVVPNLLALNANHEAMVKARAELSAIITEALSGRRTIPAWSILSCIPLADIDKVFELWLALTFLYLVDKSPSIPSPRVLAFDYLRVVSAHWCRGTNGFGRLPAASRRDGAALLFRTFYPPMSALVEAWEKANATGLVDYKAELEVPLEA